MGIRTTDNKLEDMTLEELWDLFPIVLSPHRQQWKEWAKEEIGNIYGLLTEFSPRINHIGSTAIPGILAKPIIDILVEIPLNLNWTQVRTTMEEAGYLCMSSSNTRMDFNKGYTPEGYAERVFHIHIHAIGDNDEILFRNYLRSHPATARDYETLKSNLLQMYKKDRDGYTEAKTDFVKRITRLAKK